MAVGDVARNAQTEPITGLLGGQAEVRLEHLLQPGFRHAWAFIVDVQDEGVLVVIDRQVRPLAVFQCIVQQIADATLERQRLACIGREGLAPHRDPAIARRCEVRLGDAIEQQVKVQRLDVFMDVGILDALQRALDEQLEFVEVTAELVLQGRILEQLHPQAQAGDRRAQVVGDGGEQLRALGQVAPDSLAHGIECPTDLDHLAPACLGQQLHFAAQGHVPRRLRQPLERAALPVHEDADEQQQEAGGEQDEPELLVRNALVLQADVGRRHQRREVQPLARRDLYLRDQHGRVQGLQAQRVVRPGSRQFVELQSAVENAQIIGVDEVDRDVHLVAEALAEYLIHLGQHRLLALRGRQDLHVQRLVVQRYEETRATHAAQLIEHQRPIAQGQRTEVADARGHGMRQAAGTGQQAFHLARTQLRYPDETRQRLRH